MPFAITCPACQHKFRTAKERELGKGVQCAKCGEQFYISAENQEQVRESKTTPPPVPHKSSERKSEKKGSSRDRDEETTPRKARDHDDEFESQRPARPKKRGGKIFLVLGLSFLLLLLVVGGGGYFFFLRSPSGPPSDVANRLKPQQELPTELFAYAPPGNGSSNVDYFFRYYDLSQIRERYSKLGDLRNEFEKYVPPDSGIRFEDVDAYSMSWHDSDIRFTAVRLAKPRDASEVVTTWGLVPRQVDDKKVYDKMGTERGVTSLVRQFTVFQPTPSVLVVGNKGTEGQLKQMLARSTQNFKLLFDHLGSTEALKAVSGYPAITIDCVHGLGSEGPIMTLYGRDPKPDGQVEVLRVKLFDVRVNSKKVEAVEKREANANKAKTHWSIERRRYSFYVD